MTTVSILDCVHSETVCCSAPSDYPVTPSSNDPPTPISRVIQRSPTNKSQVFTQNVTKKKTLTQHKIHVSISLGTDLIVFVGK